MIKSLLKSVYMIRNDKSYYHLLSFSLLGAVTRIQQASANLYDFLIKALIWC